MALNFSHRPIFPAHLSEEYLVSPIRIANGRLVEGIPEKNGDGCGKPWHLNRDVVEDCYGTDRGDRCGSQESVSKDIVDLLPSDPFGMDISTTFTAITGWLEDLEVGYGTYGSSELGGSNGNYSLFTGLNFIWNNALRFQTFPWNIGVDYKPNVASGFGGSSVDEEVGGVSCHMDFGSACNVDEIFCCGNESSGIAGHECNGCQEGCVGSCSGGNGGVPHAALVFSLGYLGVRDLLSVERVCRSLRSTIRSDPLLWRSIHIEPPLNEKITDDVLLDLSNRAQGNLQCLSLVDCPRITDDGLTRVLQSNLRLTKLGVPGCTRLSIEVIVNSLRAFKSMGAPGVKHLRIGGLYGVTEKHFEELKSLLNADTDLQQNGRKPHFYHRGNFYLSCDDDRAIDIEMCPRCQKLKLVYDCPAEGCQGKEHATQVCRACTLCISRCVRCGRCINDIEYEETFCLELLCSDCLEQLICQEGQDRKVGPSKSAIIPEPSYG